MNVIELNSAKFAYPNSSSTILDIDKLCVAKGQNTFLSGPSGSGKSTLLNLLSGILTCLEGEVLIMGQALASLNQARRDRFRAENLGVIFQQFNLIPYLSVSDNLHTARYFVSSGQKAKSGDLPAVNDFAKEMFEHLKLPLSCLTQNVSTLSVGQAQRVAIVRALINRPSILIADEPSSALDEEATHGFMHLLMTLLKTQDTTAIFVSHDKRLAQYFEQSIELDSINHAASRKGDSHAL